MVRTSLSQNNGNNNNNSVTSTIKDSVTPVNGKCAKPSVNGTTNGSAKSLQPSSSSSYINGTQHHKEQIQPNMYTPDPKGRSEGGGPQSVSNGIHGLNYQQQMKGHATPHYQRSYSYDTTNSASSVPNHGKYSRDRCNVRIHEGSHQVAGTRNSNVAPRYPADGHSFYANHHGGRVAQIQPQSHFRIYQGPQSLKASHVPLQRHVIVNEPINGHINGGDNLSSPTMSSKQTEESNSGGSGSLTPTSPPTLSPPLASRSPSDVPMMNAAQNEINLNMNPSSFHPPQFHPYPPHISHHPPVVGPAVAPPQPMPQLNLLWQGLPPNAQIDTDQMFILSGPFPSKDSPSKDNSGNDSTDEANNSSTSPILIAHPIPRGSTVVATPALSPPQWPNGTSLTIHVDAQYELFNRACAAAGIGTNSNKNGNIAQKEATISFSESPKFNPDARPFYPPTNNISPPASISTDESSSLSSQNSDDNIPSNLENNKGVATKHNGKTVRFQTEAGDPSNNDNDPIDEGKDKKETNRSTIEETKHVSKPMNDEANLGNKNDTNAINNQESNHSLRKRQQRQQPMVMVWNTYFPNGKMIPLRQPQPPVYFGPVIGQTHGNHPSSQPTAGHQCSPMSNNQVNHQMNSPTQDQQMMGQETNSKDITNFQVMNGLKEEHQLPTQSASPMFTQNQLQVVEAV